MTTIPINQINPSPHPVRSSRDEDAMQELAQSIREQGVIVPIKVRPVGSDYEVVYGHRRVEAARRAGLEEIPAIVEGVEDTDALIQALIENVQREDMLPLDKARALQMIADEIGGRERVANSGIISYRYAYYLFALLEEPSAIRKSLGAAPGAVGERHIRETRPVHDVQARADALDKAAREGLTARQTRQVAETIARTKDPERREFLLKTPFSSHTFDPDNAEDLERAWHSGKPSPQTTWDEFPESRTITNMIGLWRTALRASMQAITLGKMPPEAKPFMAKRLRSFAEELIRVAEELER